MIFVCLGHQFPKVKKLGYQTNFAKFNTNQIKVHVDGNVSLIEGKKHEEIRKIYKA